MSWFDYGVPRKRDLRRGVALRVRNLPPAIRAQAEKLMEKDEFIDYVIVEQVLKAPDVLLAVHVRKFGSFANMRGHREGVIRFSVPENPEWTCEGDVGRGYRE